MKSRCEQCGREGTHEFTTVGGFWKKIDPRDNEPGLGALHHGLREQERLPQALAQAHR